MKLGVGRSRSDTRAWSAAPSRIVSGISEVSITMHPLSPRADARLGSVPLSAESECEPVRPRKLPPDFVRYALEHMDRGLEG